MTRRRAAAAAAAAPAAAALVAAALLLADARVRADVLLPPWTAEGDVPPPAMARSVVPKVRDGRTGDMVLYAEPSRGAGRRGVTAAGVALGFFGSRRGPGCTGNWWLVGPLAWTCSDEAELSASDPVAEDAPSGSNGLPGHYFFIGRTGASAYPTLVAAEEGAPDHELESGWGVAAVEERTVKGEAWVRTTKGLWIAAHDLVLARTSAFHGEAVGEGPLDLAWVLADRANVWPAPSQKDKPREARARFQLVHVREESGPMVRVDDGAWMLARDLARPAKAAPPPEVTRAAERWIDVDRTRQTLVAYEGERPVYATLVSTGRAGADATPVGVHPIWVKLRTSDMGNVDRSDVEGHYSLEDVPLVQFFDGSVGLHGTYWHGDFGHARSHGCVNLSLYDARWLFAFTGPRLPQGWTAVYPSSAEQPTFVRVR